METNFIKFNESKEQYDLSYIINHIPDFIKQEDEDELWYISAMKATKKGEKLSDYATVVSIFNNKFNKKLKNNKTKNTEELVDNSKYNYYKKRFDQISWYGREDRKVFYKSILDQLKIKGKLSQNQWNHLQRLKGHNTL